MERWSWVQGGWFVCVNSMVLGLVDTWQPRGSKSEAKSEASVGRVARGRAGEERVRRVGCFVLVYARRCAR